MRTTRRESTLPSSSSNMAQALAMKQQLLRRLIASNERRVEKATQRAQTIARVVRSPWECLVGSIVASQRTAFPPPRNRSEFRWSLIPTAEGGQGPLRSRRQLRAQNLCNRIVAQVGARNRAVARALEGFVAHYAATVAIASSAVFARPLLPPTTISGVHGASLRATTVPERSRDTFLLALAASMGAFNVMQGRWAGMDPVQLITLPPVIGRVGNSMMPTHSPRVDVNNHSATAAVRKTAALVPLLTWLRQYADTLMGVSGGPSGVIGGLSLLDEPSHHKRSPPLRSSPSSTTNGARLSGSAPQQSLPLEAEIDALTKGILLRFMDLAIVIEDVVPAEELPKMPRSGRNPLGGGTLPFAASSLPGGAAATGVLKRSSPPSAPSPLRRLANIACLTDDGKKKMKKRATTGLSSSVNDVLDLTWSLKERSCRYFKLVRRRTSSKQLAMKKRRLRNVELQRRLQTQIILRSPAQQAKMAASKMKAVARWLR